MKFTLKRPAGEEISVEIDPAVDRAVARFLAVPGTALLAVVCRAFGLWS